MQVKIKSNPYEEKIVYMSKVKDSSEWNSIVEGKLTEVELTKGFFPYVVEKILDAIIEQYQNDNHGKIKVIFEGPDDEYNELVQAVNIGKYKDEPYISYLEYEKSDRYLENARDILPEIKKVYKQRIKPLISTNLPDQTAIQEDLNKFTEASDDIIPICVIGNYSSGKSTFINALLGSEILPSADRPTTAKYYKITNSKQPDRATIDFDYEADYVSIRFESDGHKYTSGKSDKELIQSIDRELEELEDKSLVSRINKTIEIINGFERKKDEHCISDLISLSVPFGKGIWGEASSNFTIIDTPGSNSASNLDHTKVLDTAMAGLTNGLPIFVSTYDSLDTNDNLDLFNKIISMDELDSRFTIIAVNQADAARLPKDGFSENDIDDLLSQAVPKKLKSEGIYFVSSIMGLGSKIDGEFMDDGYAETFEDAKGKFSQPDSRFYKQLYKYNIMAERMKEQATKEIEEQDNLMWANSGLLSIEREIKIFAEKYSHYNKCQQSEMFLRKVINTSEKQLEEEKVKHTKLKEERENELEEGKTALINHLAEKSKELRESYFAADDGYISVTVNEKINGLKNVDVKAKEDELGEKHRVINNIKDIGDKLGKSFNSIGDDLYSNFKGIIFEGKISKLTQIGPDFFRDVSDTVAGVGEWLSTSKKIEKDTADELVKHMDKLYRDDSKKMQDEIFEVSIKYWDEKCDEVKSELAKIVHETDVLTDEERENLANVIIDYEKISIQESGDIIFAKTDFDHAIRILDWRIGVSDKLKLDKLSNSFNQKLTENVNNIKNKIINDHEHKFENWINKLNEEITVHIVELNPTLHCKNDDILKEMQIIQNLEQLMRDLKFYQRNIVDMMEWKED